MTDHGVGDQKFITTSHTGLDGRVVVAFTEEQGGVDAFTLKATPAGIQIGSMKKVITTMDELQDFARMVSDLWTEHKRITPKLTTTFAGHT